MGIVVPSFQVKLIYPTLVPKLLSKLEIWVFESLQKECGEGMEYAVAFIGQEGRKKLQHYLHLSP